MSIAYIKVATAGSLRPDERVMYGRSGRDRELIAKLKPGYSYRCKTARDQNPAFHNMVFSGIRLLFDNQEEFDDFDVFRYVLKTRIYWVEHTDEGEPKVYTDEHGSHMVVRPLDTMNCTQSDLEEFWAKVKPYMGEALGWEFVEQYERDHVQL